VGAESATMGLSEHIRACFRKFPTHTVAGLLMAPSAQSPNPGHPSTYLAAPALAARETPGVAMR